MDKRNIYKPILAVTVGDPAGIGPEIAVKTFSGNEIYTMCRPVLVGHKISIREAISISGLTLQINQIQSVSEAIFKPGTIDFISIGDEYAQKIKKGIVSAEAGDIAFKSVVKAIELAKSKEVDGTVTGPIHKEAIHMAGHHFSGHTEIYAHYTGTKKFAMLLVDENIRVIHVTTHVSLRKACDLIKKERVLEVIHLMENGLKKLGIDNPRIGVAGLNPHSGDGGLFGDEDRDEILPAVLEAQKEGIDAEGPIPSDALFAQANGGKYDGCVAMYHDQGHIPFKLLGFNWDKKKKTMKSVKGVNITLGLPILRTSVDHGTAFEIAGKGLASPDALIQAIYYATKLLNE
jgi:4-phospho-D-threonate 3-dehydrogenase / 4-phospho-D-erythronate 3-dehydrogenase